MTDLIIAPAARRDLRRLDQQTAQRVLLAIRRYAETGQGDVRQLEARSEWRLRVGDWRVLFEARHETRAADPSSPGEIQVWVIEILRVLPRGRAYRD